MALVKSVRIFNTQGGLRVGRFLSLLITFTVLSFAPYSYAQQAIPSLNARVVDKTATLTSSQIETLDQVLKDFEGRKGSQIVVLMVPTTYPESIEQYSIRVAQEWRVGRKKIDDGAILVVSKSDRRLRIEVGYGLEGILTDATSKKIIDQIISPRFKENNYYQGIFDGINALISVIESESLPEIKTNEFLDPAYFPYTFSFWVVVSLILSKILTLLVGRLTSSLITGSLVSLFFWLMYGAVSIALFAGLMSFIISLIGIGFILNGSNRYGGGGGGTFGGGGASGRW